MTGVPLLIAFVVAIILMIVLISKFKVHAFLSLMLVSLLLAIVAGIELVQIPAIIGQGFSGTFTSIGIVIILGALAAWTGFTLPSAAILVLFAYGADALSGPVGAGVLQGGILGSDRGERGQQAEQVAVGKARDEDDCALKDQSDEDVGRVDHPQQRAQQRRRCQTADAHGTVAPGKQEYLPQPPA